MGARILLVEDEANMARTLTKNLERAGHTVEHAPHGQAAITRLEQRPFDMVVTDLKMPVLDGMQLLHALHERDLPPAGVVRTGYRTIEPGGPLAERPFIAINCAGLSETLLDSQLFGHRRGAFTGAMADHDGVFRAAHGGTLFLDEVSEIPLSLQPKFLRAVQEREVTPLGASVPVPVDVRLIAATNRDLEAEVRGGRFRADLFYRLNVVHIEMPPLRAHPEDIPNLVEHFLQSFSRQYRVSPKRVTAEALERLTAYTWPGNVRELQNLIERAFALSTAETITLEDLPPAVAGWTPPDAGAGDGTELSTLGDMERRLIAAALRKSEGNKKEAARLLGIDRQRLYRKIEKYGL